MRLNSYFDRNEFACKCGCGFATVDTVLLDKLTIIREHFNAPVTINSGCRCVKHNTAVGGANKSKHLEGIAADIVVKGVEPDEVYKFVDLHFGKYFGGVGKYKTFTHVDVRTSPWRG